MTRERAARHRWYHIPQQIEGCPDRRAARILNVFERSEGEIRPCSDRGVCCDVPAGDEAVRRTHEYLWWLRERTGDNRWFDGVRASEIIHLVNVAYDEDFPVNETTGFGRTVGYTGWTHPDM